jgi:succinate dehydrogenase / fumarate reductase cytochrome b subunit
MRKALGLYQSTVGKKVFMAVTGAILFLFVFVHMVGNLKIYQGPAKFDAYAEFLREVGYPAFGHGQLLWIARLVLLFCVAVHVVAALQLYFRSRHARSVGYRKFEDLSFDYSSRWMRWGGLALFLFVAYHLLDLTFGTLNPGFVPGSAYHNVVASFRMWHATLIYVAAMVFLGLHIYHGLWSTTQTLGLQGRRVLRWRRPAAAAVALVIVVGNISIPLAVLLGWVR